jgi:hypothetical protein
MAKTTRKTTRNPQRSTRKTTSETSDARAAEETSVGQRSCAYASCSARGTQTFGNNNVPSCDLHAPIFENEANDGAGIQQLMANYKG